MPDGLRDHDVLPKWDPQAVPVMTTTQKHRVLARIHEAVEERKRWADPAGAA